LGEAGYLAALIPETYGGSGLPLAAAAAILEEVQRMGCNGAACHAQMYVMGALLRHGDDHLKTKYLPDIASGKLRLQAFGVTEPDSGTDTSALKTTAVRQGDFYLVNGQKIWTSRADIAFAHVNDLAALSRHPHLRRITIETPGGDVSYPAPAPIFIGAPRQYGPAPAIGEHSSAIARRSSRR
jgi:alkylation response protein AidB-like acyl-CoA dehydrogenase